MGRVIVTGSDGQMGRTLAEKVIALGNNILVDFKTSQELNVTDPDSIDEAFRNSQYDFCINCAAYTNVEQAEKTPDPAFKVNAEGTKNLAEACKRHHVTLIHISTDYVFDGEKETPYTVDDKPNPINEYGRSKLKGEEYIREILPNHYIIRTSWLYSKKHGHNFYRTVLQKARDGQELRITDTQIGCPTDTESLANFILEDIIEGHLPYGTCHFTDGKAMTWFEFAKQILEENGLTNKTNLVLDRNYRTFAKRPRNSVLSQSRIAMK